MKRILMIAAVATLAMGAGAVQAKEPAYVAAAIADPGRPEADTKRDADRKPADMVKFAGIKPGTVVADFIPGGGYFTRIFSKVVGPTGKVFGVTNPPPTPAAGAPTPPPSAIVTIAADPNYSNVTVVSTGIGSFTLPQPVDVFFTAQNYHDLYLTRFNLNVPAVTKGIYDSIKPGGYFIVIDHVAAAGSDVVATSNKEHRIDPAQARKAIEAAGFKYVGESSVLRNPNDDYTKTVFDPSLRGHTDQFIYKFQKPKT